MKKTFYLLMTLTLIGCAGKPSEKIIEEQIVNNLLSDSEKEILAIENFEK